MTKQRLLELLAFYPDDSIVLVKNEISGYNGAKIKSMIVSELKGNIVNGQYQEDMEFGHIHGIVIE